MTIGAAILLMVFPLDAAWAEKRVALVIGNSNYANVPKLPNPSRDAISVGQMFRDAGFDNVDVIVNASNLEFKRAVRKFGPPFAVYNTRLSSVPSPSWIQPSHFPENIHLKQRKGKLKSHNLRETTYANSESKIKMPMHRIQEYRGTSTLNLLTGGLKK